MADNNYFIKGKFIVRELPQQTFLKNTFTRFIFYWFNNIFTRCLLFVKRLSLEKRVFRHKVSICAIFKNEADFLKEWLSYHMVIGVDHFYLYNNNSDDDFLSVLEPFIEKGIVDLVQWPYEQGQMSAYEDCYKKNRSETNWLGFIDIDEFVCPISQTNIKCFLASFEKYPSVAIYWRQFGSTGYLKHDRDKLVIEQYTQSWNKLSTFTKMFCNMNYEIHSFENMHLIYSNIYGVKLAPLNQFKKVIGFGINRNNYINENSIQINHYWGKAYDCFVKNKIKRTDAFYQNEKEMGIVRKKLLKSHELMCIDKDFTIQRYLLETKLKMKDL